MDLKTEAENVDWIEIFLDKDQWFHKPQEISRPYS